MIPKIPIAPSSKKSEKDLKIINPYQPLDN